MCGIAGIFFGDGRIPERALLEKMAALVAHRGPDGVGVLAEPGLGLSHRRLGIIDLAGGQQPMESGDGRWVISFNGEIFNYLELKRELQSAGVHFRTTSDTEVLLELLAQQGSAALSALNGQFAFAAWDRREKRLLLVRDRMGEKPLFFWRNNSGVVFGSELKAVLFAARELGLSPKINRQAWLDFLALNYIPGSKTLVAEIDQLPPGHFALVSSGSFVVKRYWTPVGRVPPKNAQQAQEEFSTLFSDSLKLRLRSDVPMGLFLSGGVDSSCVASAVSRSKADVRAFIADFKEPTFSEAAQAQRVAKQLGITATCFPIAPDPLDFPGLIEKLVYHADTPLADSSAVPMYLLSQSTARQVKVALTGDGGDELFGGYLSYRATAIAAQIPRSLRYFLSRLTAGARVLPAGQDKVGVGEKLERFLRSLSLDPAAAHFAWNGMWLQSERQRLIHPEMREFALSESDTFERLAQECGLDLLAPSRESLMRADQDTYLPADILVKADRTSMAHGLELRPVLLDHRIVEFARSLSGELLMNGREDKRVLRDYLRSAGLGTVCSQPKQGFSIPVHRWVRTTLRPYLDQLFHSNLVAESKLFDPQEVLRVWELHRSGKRQLGFEIWGIMVGVLWWKRFFGDEKAH